MVVAGAAGGRDLAVPREDALRRDHARRHREQGDGVAARHRHPPAVHRRLRAGRLPRRHRRRAHRADPRPLARHGRRTCSASPSSWSRSAAWATCWARSRRACSSAWRRRVVAAYWTEASTAVIYRGDGGGAARPPAGTVRHPMKKPSSFSILVSICLLPLVVRPAIASEIWIFAIFGLGANLLLGYTGLLSFGQSTFFGSAAYVAGWLLKYYGINVFLALGVGDRRGRALGAGGGLPLRAALGPLLHHAHLRAEPALLLHRLPVDQRHRRRGRHAGHPAARCSSASISRIRWSTTLSSRSCSCSALCLMKRIVESPLGKILQAIRENEVRAEAVGYNVPRFKLLAFVIGGAFSGPRGRALRDALRHRAAGGDQLRVLGQRGVRHADRRLGLALRADHRLVRVHLAVGVGERAVGALAAAARRGVRDRGAVPPRRRGGGLDAGSWSWRSSKQRA